MRMGEALLSRLAKRSRGSLAPRRPLLGSLGRGRCAHIQFVGRPQTLRHLSPQEFEFIAKKKGPARNWQGLLFSSPTWTRTTDLVINSHPLYRLSYRGICPRCGNGAAAMTRFLENGAPSVNCPV